MTILQLPAGWTETTLGEVCDITSSKRIFANEYKTSGIPFFRGKEVTEKFNGNSISTELFITEEKYNEIKNNFGVPEENDILLTSVGTLGNPYLVEKDLKFYFKDGNLTWFRNYKNIVPKRLFYWIISPQGKETLSHAQIGSTQQAYTIVSLKSLSISLPPLPEQVAIASILSSFDDKSELLREQNKTLETLAQTIFQEWFGKYSVDYPESLPGEWRVGKLGEVIDFEPREKIYKYEEYLFFDMKTLSTDGMIMGEGEYKQTSSGSSFRTNDTLLAKITPCLENGKTGFVFNTDKKEIMRGSTEFIVMRAKEGTSPYFIYNISRSQDFRDYAIKSMTGTSGRQRVQISQLKNYNIAINSNIMEKYHQAMIPVFEKININQKEIQSLSTSRDTLLPKLMSGELRVKL